MSAKLSLLPSLLLLACACALFAGEDRAAGPSVEFVGTTPCGPWPREFLQIPTSEPCDKITWQLTLAPWPAPTSCRLIATFGLQEQSAPGFVRGGTTRRLEGKVIVSSGHKANPAALIYRIQSDKASRPMSFIQINENLLQQLDRDENLAIGNEFWSYTLSRKGAGRNR